MTDQGGSPVKYIAVHPNPDPCGPFTIPIPANVLEGADESQRRRIGLVQLRFARDISALLAQSYEDIAMIIDEDAIDEDRAQDL